MSDERMPTNKMRQKQVVQLANLLTKHCREIGGFAVYTDGWSDRRIAEEAAAQFGDYPYNENHVSGLRRNLIGNFPRNVVATGQQIAAIEQIVARLEALEKWAAARPVQGFKRPAINGHDAAGK